MPAPVATWNSERDVWELETLDLFSGHSDVFSETWPISGTTRAGKAFARPMWAHLTDGSASSSSPGLLKTPTSQLAVNGGSQHPDKRKAGGDGPTLADEVEHLIPTPLHSDAGPRGGTTGFGLWDWSRNLPTPTTRDVKGHNQRRDDTCLTGALLPTPKATDGTKGGPNQRGSSGDLTLPSAAMTLLPTPTATTPYGSNQSASSGAAVRPSLDRLAPMLLPTPMAGDAKSARNSTARRNKLPPTGVHAGNTLTDILVPPTGDHTATQSDDGNAA